MLLQVVSSILSSVTSTPTVPQQELRQEDPDSEIILHTILSTTSALFRIPVVMLKLLLPVPVFRMLRLIYLLHPGSDAVQQLRERGAEQELPMPPAEHFLPPSQESAHTQLHLPPPAVL